MCGMVVMALLGDKEAWQRVDERHCLAEYGVFDAYLAGATKALWVANEGDVDPFWRTIKARVGCKMQVERAVAPSPEAYGYPREHPALGLGHALLCGLQRVDEPAVALDARTFFGREAIAAAVACAERGEVGCCVRPVGETVQRGKTRRALLCKTKGGAYLYECLLARDEGGRILAQEGTTLGAVDPEALCAVGLYALQPAVLTAATRGFVRFLREGKKEDFSIVDVLNEYLARTDAPLRLWRWEQEYVEMQGLSDVSKVRRALTKLPDGEYPRWLWR